MNKIDDLLERYWQCETSVEEERELRSLFQDGNIPEDKASFHLLFQWQQRAAGIRSAKDFIPKEQKVRKVDFYSLLKIAAVAIIFFTFGIGFYTHYHQSRKVDQILSETYSDPQEAVKETEEVVAKVSSLLLKIEEHQQSRQDSLSIKVTE